MNSNMFANVIRITRKFPSMLYEYHQSFVSCSRLLRRGNNAHCAGVHYSTKLKKELDKDDVDVDKAQNINEELIDADSVAKAEIREMKEVAHWQEEEDTPAEREVKRKMSRYKTTYGREMNEAEPEDEMAVLEYYVRKAQESIEEIDDAEYYDVIEADKRLFFKMVDLWIKDAGEPRRGHREFLQVLMNNVERFNVQYEPKAYLKILECYPQSEHTGMRRTKWFKSVWQDKILDHELGVRLFGVMHKNAVAPTDEFYNTCMRLFGPYSRATLSIRTLLFWYPRLTSYNPFPVPNKDMDKMSPVEIAFRGLRQAIPGVNASYERFEVDLDSSEESKSELSNIKLDSILSVQSERQKELLENHDVSQPVFVEGPNIMYFKKKKIQYFVMRADPANKKSVIDHKTTILTDKEWWTKFYQKDFNTMKPLSKSGEIYADETFLPTVNFEKGLSAVDQKPNEIVQVIDDIKKVEGEVYALAATDYNSPNVLRSWVKGLRESNPVLSQVTVVFNKKESFLTEGYKSGWKGK